MTHTNSSNSAPSSIVNQAILSHQPMGLSETVVGEEYTAKSNIINVLTGEYFCEQGDWPVVPFSKSVIADIPLFKSYASDSAIIVEFSPPTEYDNYNVIIFSDDQPPIFHLIFSYSDEEGLDLRTFNLVDSGVLFESHLELAVKALEANFMLISASTKFSEEEKAEYLNLVRADIDYIWNFIKQALVTPIGYAYIEAKVEVIDREVRNNSPYYWQLLKDHKVTDFTFITEK
tara:strand:+ start:874 stop:1566 length:693 start_codon:yes stop_codon:yes gene_type:complete